MRGLHLGTPGQLDKPTIRHERPEGRRSKTRIDGAIAIKDKNNDGLSHVVLGPVGMAPVPGSTVVNADIARPQRHIHNPMFPYARGRSGLHVRPR